MKAQPCNHLLSFTKKPMISRRAVTIGVIIMALQDFSHNFDTSVLNVEKVIVPCSRSHLGAHRLHCLLGTSFTIFQVDATNHGKDPIITFNRVIKS
jgi:hypothetical protein